MQLESRLEDATDALEETLRAAHIVKAGQEKKFIDFEKEYGKLDVIRSEIKLRQSCIAPARLLPHDILSIVILEACIADWKVIFSIHGVCRTWRASALDTPQAWALVHLPRIKPLEARHTIIERGKSTPVHIEIYLKNSSDVQGDLINKLPGYASRVTCMRLSHNHSAILRYPLSNLSKLVITNNQYLSREDLRIVLDRGKFPHLRSLSVRNIDFHESMTWPNPVISLKELEISTSAFQHAASIISRLADNLTHLYVRNVFNDFFSTQDPFDITFPRLRHLSIVDDAERSTSHWPFRPRTPVLESYGEVTLSDLCIHQDITTVTEAFFDRHADFKRFSQLRQLTTSSRGFRGLLEYLSIIPNALPNLEVVHCPITEHLQADMDTFNASKGRKIALIPSKEYLIFHSHPTFSLPLCGDGMECRDPEWAYYSQ